MYLFFWLLALLVSFIQTGYANDGEAVLRHRLEKSCDHKHVICQKDLPIEIKCPGHYCLASELRPEGAGTVAITINSGDVVLDLNVFEIELNDATQTGILVNTSTNVVIKNGSLNNAIPVSNPRAKPQIRMLPYGNGISLVGAQKVVIENVTASGNFNGVSVLGSADVRILNSSFSQAIDAGVLVAGSGCVTIDTCTFVSDGYGVLISDEQGVNNTAKILNSCFSDSALQGILVLQVNGLVVDGCSITNEGTFNTFNLVQLGGTSSGQIVSSAVVKNSTFINLAVAGGTLEGLAIPQAQNFIVDSCLFINNNSGQDIVCNDFSAIHPGGAGFTVSGFTISNNVIQGPAIDGIYPDIGSTNGLIENNRVSGVLKDGILADGTTYTTIRNNASSNNGRNGFGLAQTSSYNAIIDNVASGNAADGIFIAGTQIFPIACPGTFLASTNNTVQYNASFGNGGFGVNDAASAELGVVLNEIFYNTAYTNGAGDYNGFFPYQQPW